MTGIIRRDPFFRSMLSWPKWLDDFDMPIQRGLRIHETDSNIIAEAVVAGVPSNDVEVHIEDGILTIKAEVSVQEENSDEHTSSSYQYYYTTALSGGAWDKAKADINDGVVKVTIPKTAAARPRKITVKAKTKKK